MRACVCLLDKTRVNLAKTAEPIRYHFYIDSGGLKEPCSGKAQIPKGKGQFNHIYSPFSKQFNKHVLTNSGSRLPEKPSGSLDWFTLKYRDIRREPELIVMGQQRCGLSLSIVHHLSKDRK